MLRFTLTLLAALMLAPTPVRADEKADLEAFAQANGASIVYEWQESTGHTFGLNFDSSITDAGLKALAAIKPARVRSISLKSAMKITEVGFSSLGTLPSVKFLRLPPQFGDRVCSNLTEQFPGLTSLELGGDSQRASVVTAAGLKSVAKLTELRFLSLVTSLTDTKLWPTLAKLRNLKTLVIRIDSLTGEGMDALTVCKELRLLSLTARVTRLWPTVKGFESLAKIESLELLMLNGVQLSPERAKSLARLPRLSALWISNSSPVDAATLRAIGQCATLYHLSLANVDVAPGAVERLKAMQSLKWLELSTLQTWPLGNRLPRTTGDEIRQALPKTEVTGP